MINDDDVELFVMLKGVHFRGGSPRGSIVKKKLYLRKVRPEITAQQQKKPRTKVYYNMNRVICIGKMLEVGNNSTCTRAVSSSCVPSHGYH